VADEDAIGRTRTDDEIVQRPVGAGAGREKNQGNQREKENVPRKRGCTHVGNHNSTRGRVKGPSAE